jgi:hypothetical protein
MEPLTSPTRATLTAGRTGCSGKDPKRDSRKNGILAQSTLSSVYPIRSGSPERERYKSPIAVTTDSRQNRSMRYGGDEGERVASPIEIPLYDRQSKSGSRGTLITRCMRTQIMADTPERTSHTESGTTSV